MLSHSFYARMKYLILFTFMVLAAIWYVAPQKSFGACEFLSEDFTSMQGWTISTQSGTWALKDKTLEASNIGTVSTYASTEFFPSDMFSVDVDIQVISAPGEHDRVGTRIYAGGDVYFAVQGDSQEYMTNGVLAYYYPAVNELKFKIFDVIAGEWVVPLAARTVSGSVNSIGLGMESDGVVFRINGQDTDYKISGNLSNGYMFISSLRLFAGGSTLKVRFDNVCASDRSGQAPPPSSKGMALPSGQETLITSSVSSPVINTDPSKAQPIGLGNAASGGSILSLRAGLSKQAAPVDLYAGIISEIFGAEVFLFTGMNALQPLSTAGFVPWKENIKDDFTERLLSDLSVTALPDGTYYFFLFLTPSGDLSSSRLWAAPLVINNGSSDITDKEMAEEIKKNLDLIFGLSSGFSGGLGELTSIFEDDEVVTVTPANLDFSTLLSGTPVTVTADFGSGYTLESGSVMQGKAQVKVKDIVFTNQQVGADFSGIFNNILKDGKILANGSMGGNLLITQGSGDSATLSGQCTFNDLTIAGRRQSGRVDLSGKLYDFGLLSPEKITGNVRMSFSDFISGDYTLQNGYVDLILQSSNRALVQTALQSGEGPVNLDIQVDTTDSGTTLNTIKAGTAGPYQISINNVTMDQSVCPNYPIGGKILFTKQSTGTTGVVTFTEACDGSYVYKEQ